MLWNVIFEFFVKYIFGGRFNGVSYASKLGEFFVGSQFVETSTNSLVAITFTDVSGGTRSMSIGNYLSFIATLISIVAIVILCCLLIKKIYNICAHVIG